MRHLTAAILAWVALSAHAGPTTIGFENLGDLEALSGQYAGLTFQGGVVALTGAVGGSLNEFDFPPHGGVAAAVSDAPLQIDFSATVSEVGAYFTYVGGLRLTAFAADGTSLGVALSAYSDNTGSSGGPVNEFIGFGAIDDIHRILIETLDPAGGVFVLDDLHFNADPVVRGLPEPASWALGALAALMATTPRRQRHA